MWAKGTTHDDDARIRWGTHGRHLMNMTAQYMFGGDAGYMSLPLLYVLVVN